MATSAMDRTTSPFPAENGADTGKDDDDSEPKMPQFDPGELAPFWASPHEPAQLSDDAEKQLRALCDLVGNKDVAARRWEVEQAWEARLYDHGYQYLLPRKGGGWVMPPFATNYNRAGSQKNGQKWYGYETNIYSSYGEIISAALTRDIPAVRFEPQNPTSDSDITCARAATKYARLFARANDLLDLQHQLVYYLRNDGRALVVVDHVLDAQRFGRQDLQEPVIPEDASAESEHPAIWLVRHGETDANAEGKSRGRLEVPLDERGERQADRAAAWLKQKHVARIVSSPVERSLDTARTVAAATGAPLEMDDRLASLNIGDMAGEDGQETQGQVEEYEQEPDRPMPGGESFSEFKGRVEDVLTELLQSATPDAPVAIVTHDSVITEIFRLLMGDEIPVGGQVPPGGVAAVETNPDGSWTAHTAFPAIAPEPTRSMTRGVPRGREVAEVYGKLEHKVPINAMTLSDCPFVQVSKEYDFAYVKGMFPDKADKIKPGSAGAGENELDRIARINVALALEASYVTGDSMVRDCTVQRTWFRPSMFMEVADMGVRAELLNEFPDGCLVVIAGEALIFARQESLDDHCTLIQAFPGSGMNRPSLCSKLLSVQKRVNNWIDLQNDYFICCVPQRWFNVALGDPNQIKEQTSVPGAMIPYDASGLQNQAATGIPPIWVEPAPQQNPAMPDMIQQFINPLAQLVSGALPSLFGAPSNTDASSGVAVGIQRDQALGRLGTPWHAMQVGTASYFAQAVRLAARMRTEPICGMDGDTAVRLEISELKGQVLAFPESGANFPESWVQKQSRYQMLLTEAANPMVAQFLSATPLNMRTAVRMAGIEELEMPQADAWEKQVGEIEMLMRQAPVPNPAQQQAMAQAQQGTAALVAKEQQGGMVAPEEGQAAVQAMQAAQAMPPMVSSIPVDADCDDHATEMQTCLWWLNSPAGRAMKSGSPEERAGWLNVKLHMLAHKADVKPPQPPMKPVTVTANFKDLPPEAAAALLNEYKLPGAPQSVAQDRVAKEALRHPKELGLVQQEQGTGNREQGTE